MREATVLGVEKPFPWVALALYGAVAAVGVAGGGGLVVAFLTLGFGPTPRNPR